MVTVTGCCGATPPRSHALPRTWANKSPFNQLIKPSRRPNKKKSTKTAWLLPRTETVYWRLLEGNMSGTSNTPSGSLRASFFSGQCDMARAVALRRM